jgi:biopolymer transport protein ExbD
MRNDYVETKPSLLSSINIVPLIGILAALLVVIMMGFPSLTMKHNAGLSWGGCGGPLDPSHIHTLKIHLNSSGNATLDGAALTNGEITEIIASAPKQDNHIIIAEVDIDGEASYQDAMSLISALHKSDLEEKNIRILDPRWK